MRRLPWIVLAGMVAVAVGCGGSETPPFDIVEDTGPGDVVVDADNGTQDVVVDTGTDTRPDTAVDASETVEDSGPVSCTKNSECVDAPVELGECQKKVCDDTLKICVAGWDNTCCMEKVYFQEDFESGMDSWSLADPKPNDYVSWQIVANRKAFGEMSAYFGNTTCHTYYSGALDAQCDPVDPEGADSAAVRASITSKTFFLPPISVADTTFVASAYLWVESEPMIPGVDSRVQPDQFRMSIVSSSGENEVVEEIFSSTFIEKDSDGIFVFISGNITSFSGKDIAVRLSFDSIDGSNNMFEGAYVDEIKVFSTCENQCDTGNSCPADAEACSDDMCQPFGNKNGKGSCAYPMIPHCVEPDCTPTNVLENCPNDDPCVVVTCPEGACVYTELPEDECCRQIDVLATSFEDGTVSGFELWSYQDNETVKWGTSSYRSSDGSWAMYYGDPVSRSYATPGTLNTGEASSPELELRGGQWAFLTFDLMMSSEWDEVATAAYYNPASWDLLTVQVVERMGQPTEKTTDVWSSHLIHGTTGGEWVSVGVDLSEWAGKVVRVRFRFETGSDEYNDFEGVYIDNFRVQNDTCSQRNCQSEFDCGIDGVCRVGSCTDQICDVTIAGQTGCCAVQQDCDDQDECTADGCVNNVCLHEYVEKPGCCFEDVRAEYTFDIFGDLDGFAVVDNSVPGSGGADVRWHLSESRASSGTRSMYYGNSTTGNFDNGGIARGTSTSPEFSIPASGDYVLSFYVFIDVQQDAGLDVFKVDIMDGLTPTPVFSKSALAGAAYGTWFQVSDISLNAFQGKTIKLRFTFDSVDNQVNTGEGVFVDSIQVTRVCE